MVWLVLFIFCKQVSMHGLVWTLGIIFFQLFIKGGEFKSSISGEKAFSCITEVCSYNRSALILRCPAHSYIYFLEHLPRNIHSYCICSSQEMIWVSRYTNWRTQSSPYTVLLPTSILTNMWSNLSVSLPYFSGTRNSKPWWHLTQA